MPQTTEIHLHNTLSNQTEPFVPQKSGEVTMYTCGPTVYDYAHIGNYRTFVFQDILRRFLKLRGYRLTHVMNLTDVDDRIIANAPKNSPRPSSTIAKPSASKPPSTGCAPRTTSIPWSS